MDHVRRLVTSLDIDAPTGTGDEDERRMSIRALHELELASGRRVVLLADRGWTSRANAPDDVWAHTSRHDMIETARMVVGPDEPAPGRTTEEESAGHWAHLAAVAADQGVHVDPSDLAALPHDVHVSKGIHRRCRAGTRRAPGGLAT